MTELVEIGLPPALADATDALARDITAAEPLARFRRVQERFEQDGAAQSRLRRLTATQQRIQRRQAAGQVSHEDVAELRSVRQAVEADPVITDYWRARRDAVASLRSVNAAISRLLAVDFAALARRPGCC